MGTTAAVDDGEAELPLGFVIAVSTRRSQCVRICEKDADRIF